LSTVTLTAVNLCALQARVITHLFQTACGESLCSACILPIHFTDVESTGAMPLPVVPCYKRYYEPTLPFLASLLLAVLSHFFLLFIITGTSVADQPSAVHLPAVLIYCGALCTRVLFIGWLILDYLMMLCELQ
jgi:hypothetical protein